MRKQLLQPDATGAPSRAPALRALTATSLACAYGLVVLGDTVRVTESGMGCASWPLCNGTIGLGGSYHALLEQSHRYAAALVSVLVAATFAAAWRQARPDRLVFRAAAFALGLIGVQVVLGAITVFAHNAGWTVALHLGGAWLVLGAVTLTAVAVWRTPSRGTADRPRPPLTAAPRTGPRRAGPRRAGPGRLPLAAAVSLFALAVSGMLVLHEGVGSALWICVVALAAVTAPAPA